MKIIVGLGNPGKKYERTRHNMGFRCLDIIRETLEFPEFQNEDRFRCEISRGRLNEEEIILAKPQTFMNNSGSAVRALVNFSKVPLENLWIISDDIDLALGSMRIRKCGGAGTHNGLRSVIGELSTENFPRIRIGIESRGVESRQELESFVLHSFLPSEKKLAEEALVKAADACISALKTGIAKAMENYN